MTPSCAQCQYFDRAHQLQPVTYHGNTRFPATARCKRAAPPWPVVTDTDWCGQFAPRVRPAALHEDNGA